MTNVLWTGSELTDAMGGTYVGLSGEGPVLTASDVTFDSRQVKPGDIFFALSGERDGHDFVADAFKRGAVLAVTKRPVEGGPCLLVPDVFKALYDLAEFARERDPFEKRGAVTGSVGKTSVTQMVMAAISMAGLAHGPVKSFNNHIGVPLTMARMPAETERVVIEIGMNHAGEIEPLSHLVKPDAVIITNVGPVHTENFEDGETGVMKAKAEIFEGLKLNGLAILNADDKWFAELSNRADEAGAVVASFGESEQADAQLLEHRIEDGRAHIKARFRDQEVAFSLAATGKHHAVNAMAVLLMCEALDVELTITLLALEAFQALDGRGKTHVLSKDAGKVILIDESYNANPVSMAATLKALGAAEKIENVRRIAVLTDMLELGVDEARLHAALATVIAENHVDKVYLAGPLMKYLWETLPESRRGVYADKAEDLIAPLTADLKAGDVVLVKGSNGSHASRIVAGLLAQAS
ncbi:MAG: UDP-N-acetylmuramoyl-tripeptide--D-alanyl-D-alanine ligase [Asticcacaulis sp.]